MHRSEMNFSVCCDLVVVHLLVYLFQCFCLIIFSQICSLVWACIESQLLHLFLYAKFSAFVLSLLHDRCIFSLYAAVLSFDEEVSKTISLEQCKAMAHNDSGKTVCKDSSEEKGLHETETLPELAKVSGTHPSISTPRQLRASGASQKSTRSSTARSVRGTYVKTKSSFPKNGHLPSPSSSLSKLTDSRPVSSVTTKVVDSKFCAPKMSPKGDAPVANSTRCIAADDVANFSQLFTGSSMSVM